MIYPYIIHRFFILFVLLVISCNASSSSSSLSSSSDGYVKSKFSKRTVGNSTLLKELKPDSICVKSIFDDGRIQACLNPGVCLACSAFCFNNDYFFYCCDGDICCCYLTSGPCNRVEQCPLNDC